MRVLITGGNGFVGRRIVERCLQRGWDVATLHRSPAPDLQKMGVTVHQGDCARRGMVLAAAHNCDIVFHVAAKAGVWGPYEDYFQANVVATRNILNVCQELGIHRLVHTSSPSVTFSGRDQIHADENESYPTRFLCHYSATKALAEQEVLAANAPGLATTALRPHLVWGPGDPHLVPRLVEKFKAGRVRIVGNGQQKIDSTYVDNAADAHLAAADALTDHQSANAGKAYFISNNEPMPIADLLNKLLETHNLGPISKHIGAGSAYIIGALLESVYMLLGKNDEPPMTRFVARQLATNHYFDLSGAQKDFQYTPSISINEGLERLRAYANTDTAPETNATETNAP